MMRTKQQRLSKVIGIIVIASLWAAVAYLLIYYAILLYFGPDRLHSMLGDNLYNALIPVGGFRLFLLAIVCGASWGVPFVLASILTVGVLRLAFPGQSLRARLRVAALTGLILTASLPLVLFDGWPTPLWALVCGDDTEFAPQYSAWSFFQIRIGMTELELERTLGKPLEIWPHEDEFVRYTSKTQLTNTSGKTYGWQYTRSPNNSSYRRRIVDVKDGRVVGKGSEFYVD